MGNRRGAVASVAFRVEGPVVPAVRMTQRTKFLPPAQRYLAYQGEVRLRAKEAMAGAAPLAGPVVVRILIAARERRYDLDNGIKGILDSLNRVAFVDDKQVVRIDADVRDGEFEYVHVTVTPMGEGDCCLARFT